MANAFYRLLVVLYTVQFQILPPNMCTQFYSTECFIMPPPPLQTEFKGGYYFQYVCLCICYNDFVWTYILR